MSDDKKTHRHGARPACTPELVERLCAALRLCPDLTAAASDVGLSRFTVYGWKERAKEGAEPYATLWPQLDAARQVYKRRLLRQMRRLRRSGTKEDAVRLRACTWELEKYYPEDFGSRVEVTGAEGGPVQTVGGVVILGPLTSEDGDGADP